MMLVLLTLSKHDPHHYLMHLEIQYYHLEKSLSGLIPCSVFSDAPQFIYTAVFPQFNSAGDEAECSRLSNINTEAVITVMMKEQLKEKSWSPTTSLRDYQRVISLLLSVSLLQSWRLAFIIPTH